MYYSLIIDVNNKTYYEKDLDYNKLIVNYVEPYLLNKNFIVDGYIITRSSVNRFKIVASDIKIDAIVDIEKRKFSEIGLACIYSVKDAIKSEYVKDVTNDIINNHKNTNEASVKNSNNSKNVFIVHGHNHNLVTEVENFLRSVEYTPIVSFKVSNDGKTIIEKIDELSSDLAYAIVIYSKCDRGFSVKDGKENEEYRARQNVVFEHGLLVGKLGREKITYILEDDNIEIPSDLSGVIYETFEPGWQNKIAKNMKKSGLKIDLNRI